MTDEKEIARLRAEHPTMKSKDAWEDLPRWVDEVERLRGEVERLRGEVAGAADGEEQLARAEVAEERAEKAEAERDAATRVAAEYHAHTRALMDFVDHLVKHQEAHKIPMPLYFINQVMAARTSAEVYALIDNARADK